MSSDKTFVGFWICFFSFFFETNINKIVAKLKEIKQK